MLDFLPKYTFSPYTTIIIGFLIIYVSSVIEVDDCIALCAIASYTCTCIAS